jgi:predicted site-specific integrase-resolvase
MSKAAMVALYARVSSEQQNKRGTIESQIAALKERISADGAQIVEDMWCATIRKSAFATTMMAGGEVSKAA